MTYKIGTYSSFKLTLRKTMRRIITVIALGLIGYSLTGVGLAARKHFGNYSTKSDTVVEETATSTEPTASNCQEREDGIIDCTTTSTKARLYDLRKAGKLEMIYTKPSIIMPGSISMYSRADSCHYPQGDKCLTAAGNDTTEGHSLACPYSVRTAEGRRVKIKLGTKVTIMGHTYTCDDRYADWVELKHGYTFDIFTEDQPKAIQFGRQIKEVIVHIPYEYTKPL